MKYLTIIENLREVYKDILGLIIEVKLVRIYITRLSKMSFDLRVL
jgi:hypothetical protein